MKKKIKDKKKRIYFNCLSGHSRRIYQFKIIQNTKNLNKKVFKNIKKFKPFST